MTTKEIRQEALETMGCDRPMSYAEAVRTAEGYLEELGLVGYLSLGVDYNRYSSESVQLIWHGYFSLGPNLIYARFEAPTAERMLTGFRLELSKMTDPKPFDLVSIGTPTLNEPATAGGA